MEYEIVWTDPASIDLQGVHDYIAADNPAAAQRTVAAIIARAEMLRTMPREGTAYPRGGRQAIREVLEGKYRIFYRIINNAARVEILAVWHSARQNPKFPR